MLHWFIYIHAYTHVNTHDIYIHIWTYIFIHRSVCEFFINPVCVVDMSAISKNHAQSATWRSVKLVMKHIVQAHTLGT